MPRLFLKMNTGAWNNSLRCTFIIPSNAMCLLCALNQTVSFSVRHFFVENLTCSNVILNSNLFQKSLHLIPHFTNLLKISLLAAFRKAIWIANSFRFCWSIKDTTYLQIQQSSFYFISPCSFNIMSGTTKTRSIWSQPFTVPSVVKMTLKSTNEKIYIKLITSFSSQSKR